MNLTVIDNNLFKPHKNLCLISDSSEYGYILISKNASSYCRSFFTTGCNWTYDRYENFPDTKFIVCLRDPISRWVSGICEYFYRYHRSFNIKNPQVLKFISERLIFDEHTEPQVNFISEEIYASNNIKNMNLTGIYRKLIDLNRLIFFKVNDNLSDNMYMFAANELKVDITFRNKEKKSYNTTDEIPDKKRNADILYDYLESKPDVIDKIKKLYADDYKLIENVKFYGSN